MIREKLTCRRKKKNIEDNPTEKRMEEHCKNIVPLLKFISGC